MSSYVDFAKVKSPYNDIEVAHLAPSHKVKAVEVSDNKINHDIELLA
ncbi:MAG: hypothetical protein WA104_05245 [Thermodesulfovibrionales bacterium]|nr:hypothetical protein [Nitrospinota bacterium]